MASTLWVVGLAPDCDLEGIQVLSGGLCAGKAFKVEIMGVFRY